MSCHAEKAMTKRLNSENGFIVLIVATAASFLTAPWYAFVAVKLWGWFILPVFEQAPHLGIVHMIGIQLFVCLFLPVPTEPDDGNSNGERIFVMLTKAAVIPALVLGFGWVWHNML